jgi:drug/metabolite transporter (DMT)-like permease
MALPRSSTLPAFAALIAGALAMGISPVFVRLAEVGPFTSAFYRVGLALPLLWLWAALEARSAQARPDPGWTRAVLLGGLLFAGDLFFWHLAIVNTTIANATFLATLAPVWVALFSGLFIGEAVTRAGWIGLGCCVAGGALLIGASATVAPERLAGDLYGVLTSVFFGLYFLAIRVARREGRPGLVIFRSTLVTAAVLFVVALLLENAWWPATLSGAMALVAMAAVSHVGGQGLLAYALGHLSASFSALVIFLEAVFAAGFALMLFGEHLSVWQGIGGAVILIGIAIARPRDDAPTKTD